MSTSNGERRRRRRRRRRRKDAVAIFFPPFFFFPLQPRPRNVTIPITTAITAAAYVAAAEVDHLHPIRRDIRLKNKETISAIRKIA